MAVTDNKVAVNAGFAKKKLPLFVNPAAGLTAAITRVVQVPHSFLVEQVNLFCSGLTDAVDADVGIVRPGKTIQGVTLAIGGTKSKIKVSAAFDAVMPQRSATGGVPAVVHKAIEDNIIFSSIFTITATASAKRWGAIRVQMDGAKVVSTKVVSTDQAYVDEAGALAACPAPDAGYLDLGTITIEVNAAQTFTARTTLLDAGELNAVNYNGVAAGLVSCQTAAADFVAGEFVAGAMTDDDTDRAVSQMGGLIVLSQTTTAATGAVVDGLVDITYRPWPLDGEVAILQ